MAQRAVEMFCPQTGSEHLPCTQLKLKNGFERAAEAGRMHSNIPGSALSPEQGPSSSSKLLKYPEVLAGAVAVSLWCPS